MGEFDCVNPILCTISNHAIERYNDRRKTTPDQAYDGVYRLVERLNGKRAPLRINQHGPSRRLNVGEFVLIFSSDYGTLITLWRRAATPQRKRQTHRRSGRKAAA